MSRKAINFVLLGWLLFILPVGGLGAAEEDSRPEYQVKAEFLYNFTKFVEWPAGNSPSNSPIVIGVLGKSPISTELGRVVRDKTVNGRKFLIKSGASAADLTLCHIVFISRAQDRPLAEILSELQKNHVLTVGDVKGFTQAGGMINFIIEEQKVRFEINDETARKAGLTISSKLLNLAKKSN